MEINDEETPLTEEQLHWTYRYWMIFNYFLWVIGNLVDEVTLTIDFFADIVITVSIAQIDESDVKYCSTEWV